MHQAEQSPGEGGRGELWEKRLPATAVGSAIGAEVTASHRFLTVGNKHYISPHFIGMHALLFLKVLPSLSQDDIERDRVETEMAGGPETLLILDMLRATRTSARDRQSAMERTIREEARKLKQGEGGGEGISGGGGGGGTERGVVTGTQRQVVDFETLTFSQGAHFRSNKSINLPPGSTK